MEDARGGNQIGWTTEIFDGTEITVFRVPPGTKLRIKMPDGTSCEITAPPGSVVFVAEEDYDEIDSVNKALEGKPN